MGVIYTSIQNAIPFYLLSIPFLFIDLLFQKKMKTQKLYYRIGFICSVIFILGITCYTDIIAENFSLSKLFQVGNKNFIPVANLISMSIMAVSGNLNSIINILGNVALFVPVGFFWKGLPKSGHVVLKGALLSLAIEIFQSVFARAADVDDILLNTLGCFIGVKLFILTDILLHNENSIAVKSAKRLNIIPVIIWSLFALLVIGLKWNKLT